MQVNGLTADSKARDAKVDALNQQLSDGLRVNAELRTQLAQVAEDARRGAAERVMQAQQQVGGWVQEEGTDRPLQALYAGAAE